MIEEKIQVGEKVTGEVIEFWQKGSEITEATVPMYSEWKNKKILEYGD